MEMFGVKGTGEEVEEMRQKVRKMLCELRSLDFILGDVESLQF